MMKASWASIGSLFVILLWFGSGSSQPFQIREDVVRALSVASNDFSVAIYQQIVKDDENSVCSPFSVLTVLAMLLEGANGTSAEEIRATTRLNGMTTEDMEAAFAKMLTSLKRDRGTELAVANSVWVLKNFHVLETFKRKLNRFFDAEERQLDLGTAVRDVNQWVDGKTRHKIPKLLSSVPSETVMILLNAIYFKGTWQTEFAPDRSREKVFKSYDETDKKTTFMNLEKMLYYGDSEALNAQVVELPYQGGDISMFIYLPRYGSTLAQMEKKLTPYNLLDATRSLYENLVLLSLPKFKIESDIALNEPLQALGLKNIFTDRADLSGISPNSPIKVSRVIQKATIEVNEEGSEASAATVVKIGLRTAHFIDDTVYFNANRPFMFTLYHKPTQSVLFMGRVVTV